MLSILKKGYDSMIHKSRRAIVSLAGLGLASVTTATADTIVDSSDLEYLGTPQKLRGSIPINAKPTRSGDSLEWINGNGSDLKAVNVNGVGRAPTVKFTSYYSNGSVSVGSGAFIGNSTILSVAHNFIGGRPTRITATIGSNTPVNKNWSPTSGISIDIDPDDIYFVNKQKYEELDGANKETSPYDLAVVKIKVPFQFIVNAAKRQAKPFDLGTYKTLQLVDEAEIDRLNDPNVNITGEHLKIYGYPAASAQDQVYFDPDLEQGRLYEVDTTVNSVGSHDSDIVGKTRIARLKHTTLGGMSGSNVQNEQGKVFGVHQSATPRNPKTDGVPAYEKGWAANEMVLNKHHYKFIKDILKRDTLKGFVTDQADGNRYYFDENGEFVYNTTKVIKDGNRGFRTFRFDAMGVATDEGAANDFGVTPAPNPQPGGNPTAPAPNPQPGGNPPAEQPKVVKTKEKIPFDTEYIDDPNMADGDTQVVQNGEEGEVEIITTTMGNNPPTVVRNTIKPAKNKIVKRGIKVSVRKTEPIQFKTIEVEDDTIPDGTRVVKRPGVLGLREIINTSVPDKPEVPGTGSGRLTFKSDTSVSRRTETKGRSILMVIDSSGSFSGKVGYLRQDIIPVLNSLSDKDEIQFAVYSFNSNDSYKGAVVSKMLNKTDALRLVNSALGGRGNVYSDSEWKNAMDRGGFTEDRINSISQPFEQTFDQFRNKDLTPNIIQWTDEWMDLETIDDSFANYARTNAKTFMSVIYAGPGSRSYSSMRLAGHPNIYVADGPNNHSRDIIEQIKATTTEVVTVGETPTTHIKIGGEGVTVTRAKLTGPTTRDLPITNGRVDFTDKLQDGNYTVEYEATGDGTLTGQVDVDKNIGTPVTTTLRKTPAIRGSDNQTTKVLKEPVDELVHVGTGGEIVDTITEVIPYTTTMVDDEDLAEGLTKVVTEGSPGVRTIKKTYKTVKGKKVGEPTKIESVDTKTMVPKVIHRGVAGETEEVRTEPIPFVTEIIEDETLPEGTDVVTVEGMTGERQFRSTYKTVRGKKVGQPLQVDEYITKHMRTKIIHRGVKGSKTESEVVPVGYATRIVKDPTLLKGERKVVQAGQTGEKTITRTWTTWRKRKIGEPTNVSERITKEPVEEIIHVGTREDVMNVNFAAIANQTVSGPKAVSGMKGQKALFDFFSVAEGARVGESRQYTHLLRMPVNEVAGVEQTKPTVNPVHTMTLPDVYRAKPAGPVAPAGNIRPSALSVLRGTKSTDALMINTEAVQRLFQALKSLSVRRWR